MTRAYHADAPRWHQARTLRDLGELNAQWLEGRLASQPGYAPNAGPDPETQALSPALATVNRAGSLRAAALRASGAGVRALMLEESARTYTATAVRLAVEAAADMSDQTTAGSLR